MVIPSLKSTGIFSMQYYCLPEIDGVRQKVSSHIQNQIKIDSLESLESIVAEEQGGIPRSRGQMSELVASCNGKIIFDNNLSAHLACIHIVKKDFKIKQEIIKQEIKPELKEIKKENRLHGKIKLSILVLTVPSRVSTLFPLLLLKLNNQIGNQAVEVLGLFDNKKSSTGMKRNHLLDIAQGDYITFIDDDDDISDNYIFEIMEAIKFNPDCICFDSQITYKGLKLKNFPEGSSFRCKYSSQYIDWDLGADGIITNHPYHTMVWKSTIAKNHRFPDISYGEDTEWSVDACKEIKKEIKIDKILYWYKFDKTLSESYCQKPQQTPPPIILNRPNDGLNLGDKLFNQF